jgi:hypothetical protein
MDGVKMWGEGPLVDSACENENCSEHMIAVRYPATMEYINHLGAVYAYFDLAMRCSTCGSLYPPANEGQLETRESDPVLRMREESGTVKTDDKLVMFLYLLARDWVPTGTIDEIVDYKVPASGTFTNGWLAQWAQDVVKRLHGEPFKGESSARRDALDESPGGR